jgi:hypothetical protein
MIKTLSALILGLISVCSGYSLTPEEILTNSDQNRSVSANCEMVSYLEDYRLGKLSDKQKLICYIKGSDKSMVLFLEPAGMKNRKILMIRDDMWVFLPGTKKPVIYR